MLALILVATHPLTGSAGGAAPPDSLGRPPQPGTALLLGLVPGLGQVYNGAWLKALVVIAAEAYYVDQFLQASGDYDAYARDFPESGANPHLDLRNGSAWRALLVYILGMLDAYVDAHLSTFPQDISDPEPTMSAPNGEHP
ncbi:MAG: hypothetical protein V3U35_06410 [Candidatus Neomarinimicrobiota bacterium]